MDRAAAAPGNTPTEPARRRLCPIRRSMSPWLRTAVNNDRLSNPPSRICSTDSVAWPYVGAAGVDASSRFWLRARNRRSEEHTSELQSQSNLVCRLLLEKK